ncbi:hypothetical protein ES703_106716 [subsurface metagenome]
MVYDHVDIFEGVFHHLGEARIDSLTSLYTWEDVDLTDEIDSVSKHLDYYADAVEEITNFVVLIKTGDDLLGKYEIGPESDFKIMMIPAPVAAGARVLLATAAGAAQLLVDGMSNIYNEVDKVFVVDLDPTVLDFSQVDSDTALVELLELSNPDFLSLTTYGIDQFHAAGDSLEKAFDQLGIFFDYMTDLAYAVLPYEEDFDIDGQLFIDDMETASDAVWEIHTDFAYPDSTTIIDGERVNLSAWFDSPPPSFLVMWKNFIFGIDSTLGGLFPDRFALAVKPEVGGVAPRRFALYPNYPNPFNPSTRITFDVPSRSRVSLVVYDLLGNEVTRLLDEELDPGRKVVTWDAQGMPTGIYFIMLERDGQRITNKMMLMK